MADQSGIFICPSCQAVVKGGLREGSGLVCPECEHQFGMETVGGLPGKQVGKQALVPRGRSGGKSASVIRDLTSKKGALVKPLEALGQSKMVAKSLEEARIEMSVMESDDEMIMPDGTRKVRRRRRKKKDEKNKSLVLFLLGWFCVLAIIFALFKVGREDGADEQDRKAASDTEAEKDMEAVMMRLLPTIGDHFQRFLYHSTTGGREQFIDRSAELSLAFSEFYTTNVFPQPTTRVKRVGQNVLSFSDDQIAIETIWEDEGGLKWGAVHVFDKSDGWKLDWENFGPYSSELWSRFRSNLGATEGEFRLLVRKRMSAEKDAYFYLSFYRPPQIFETENEYKKTQSPEVRVAYDSDLGRKFLRLWEEYQEGKAPYGSILAKELDPRNHLRITVRLAWEKNDSEEGEMVLKEIMGVGWFGKRIQEYHEEAVRRVSDEATEKLSESPVDES